MLVGTGVLRGVALTGVPAKVELSRRKNLKHVEWPVWGQPGQGNSVAGRLGDPQR